MVYEATCIGEYVRSWKPSIVLTRPQSGLTQECLRSPHTTEEVEQKVLDYIKKWIPQKRTGVLAGNSVHADRAFLVQEMPKITDHLHYRSDISSG